VIELRVTLEVPVSEKLAGVPTPETLAVTVSAPVAVGCAVTLAKPLLLVTAVAPDGKLTPLPAKVTVAPDTTPPDAFLTIATRGLVKFVPTGDVWPEPEDTAMLAGGAAVPVSEKLAGVPTPETLAVTVRAPVAVGCAVTLAKPLLLVTAVAPEGKLTPLPAKVTVAPDTTPPDAFLTIATSGLVKFVPTGEV
jgi:hypothetical protein